MTKFVRKIKVSTFPILGKYVSFTKQSYNKHVPVKCIQFKSLLIKYIHQNSTAKIRLRHDKIAI